jgi:hypothetical protein
VKRLEPNAWYHITWLDAVSHDSGDPKEAKVCVRQNVFRYLRTVPHTWRKHTNDFLVFQMGRDSDDQTNAGWFALPLSMLLALEKIPCPKNELTDTEVQGD